MYHEMDPYASGYIVRFHACDPGSIPRSAKSFLHVNISYWHPAEVGAIGAQVFPQKFMKALTYKAILLNAEQND